MKNLNQRFARFFLKNRNKGIPNLMLYIALGNALVIIMSMINGGNALYELLYFDKVKILQGQIWRLVTYVFTQTDSSFLSLIFLYIFYILGRYMENHMGTFKFNLFYFSGVLLMDVFAMIFCPAVTVGDMVSADAYNYLSNVLPIYWQMAYYLHLSLILAFATSHPDSQFYIFFIIPVRAWLLALVYLIWIGISIFNMCYPVNLMPHALFPLVGLLNYFLFFGADIVNLLPPSWRVKLRKNKHAAPKKTGTIPFSPSKQAKSENITQPYIHKCSICSRTDITNPELEFRYCSRCSGFHCYCEDHIANHEHIK